MASGIKFIKGGRVANDSTLIKGTGWLMILNGQRRQGDQWSGPI